MAYAIVASTAKASVDHDTVTTDPIDTSGADLIIIGVCDFDIGTSVEPTDNKSNTDWIGLTLENSTGTRTKFWYMRDANVGSGHTFTYTSADTYPVLFILALSGSAVSPADQEAGHSNSNDTIQPGDPSGITPSEDNEIVVAMVAFNIAGGATINGGFTEVADIDPTTNQSVGGMMARLIQTTAANANPTFTIGGGTSGAIAASIASFKAAAAGGLGRLILTRPA